jgi:hypothetical protein
MPRQSLVLADVLLVKVLAVQVAYFHDVPIQQRDPANPLAAQRRRNVGDDPAGTDANDSGFGIDLLIKSGNQPLPVFRAGYCFARKSNRGL